MMENIGLAIEAKKLKASTALPTAFQKNFARPPKRESEHSKNMVVAKKETDAGGNDPQYRDKKKGANQRQEVLPEERQSHQKSCHQKLSSN